MYAWLNLSDLARLVWRLFGERAGICSSAKFVRTDSVFASPTCDLKASGPIITRSKKNIRTPDM